MQHTRLLVAFWLLAAMSAFAAPYPAPKEADYIIRNFRFHTGETLPELRIHYRTVGEPKKDAKGRSLNAVLIMHGTGGSGANFLQDIFAGELFGPGQPLDATKYFIIIRDGIGHGKSSKPSDGMRARFPKYDYDDMVAADYRLLTEGLGVNHLRLVMGTSMGGMHSWVWGEKYPDFMDLLLPLASLPVEIAGRNRMWRKIAVDAIVNDPEYRGGDYTGQPRGLKTDIGLLLLMSSNAVLRQEELPTRQAADSYVESETNRRMSTTDANDLVYALEASRNYNPAPKLGSIKTKLLAINFADDLINPPELNILETHIKQVPNGRAIVIPMSEKTRGHGTHTLAAVWKQYLVELLEQR
jgi:homoserine O-acetyltransferase